MTVAGNWTDNGTFTHNNNRVIFDGNGTITTNETFWELEKAGGTTTLQAGSADITIEKGLLLSSGVLAAGNNTITISGDLFDSDGTGDGVPGTFTGSFTDDTSMVIITNPGITNIYGSNTFWNFQCTTAGATILFQIAELQIIANNIILTGTDGGDLEIKLGNENGFLQDPPLPPGSPPAAVPASPVVDGANQWQIRLDNLATITDVKIQWCFAVNPITPDPSCEDFNGNNDGWLFFIPIEYSWTEDFNYNGRIDHIRVRVNSGVILSGTFVGLAATVEGYAVAGFAFGGVAGNLELDQVYEFFVELVEGEELDTDVTPQWKLTANDPVTGLYGTVGGAMVEYGSTAPLNTPVDRAPPAMGYTLAVSGKNEIFIHFSEPVRKALGGVINAADFDYDGGANVTGLTRVSTDGGTGTTEALLLLDGPVTAGEIMPPHNDITIQNNIDDMVTVVGPPVPDVFLLAFTTHRVSDLGLGPTGVALIQPVWAINDPTLRTDEGGIGRIEPSTDIVNLGDFDGSGWLQDQDITMQAVLTAGLTDVDLWWDTAVAAPYRMNDMWLPTLVNDTGFDHGASGSIALYDLVNVANPNVVEQDHTNSSGNTRDYEIDSTDSRVRDGVDLEFFFEDSNGFFYGRVEDSTAADWYYGVRPFAFMIRDVREQAGRVTILSNVINPTRGEKTELYYVIENDGLVTIQVFNLGGDLVEVLYRGSRSAGEYSTAWDGTNRSGDIVARGVYFIRVVGPDIDEIRKVIVIK
jgi:hypothetical protein